MTVVEPIDMAIVRHAARQVAQGLISSQTGPHSPGFADDRERARLGRLAHRVLAADLPADSREAQVARAFLELEHTRSSDVLVNGFNAAREIADQEVVSE